MDSKCKNTFRSGLRKIILRTVNIFRRTLLGVGLVEKRAGSGDLWLSVCPLPGRKNNSVTRTNIEKKKNVGGFPFFAL